MKKRIFPRALAYSGCAIFALTTVALAQDTEPKDVTVQVRHDSKDSEAPPLTHEKEPFVIYTLEAGYVSEYNFRGTNLMPGSDGGAFYQAVASIPKLGPGSLQLGIYGIHQLGTASVDDWSISEGGGGAGIPEDTRSSDTGFNRFATTTQTSFHEIDLFVLYTFPLGPIDVTLGNVAFFIDRKSQTFETDVFAPGGTWPSTGRPDRRLGPLPTVEDEQFDRIFIRLSTTKLSRYITPSIFYWQTIYNEGTQPTSAAAISFPNDDRVPADPGPNHERNEALGGYLEGRLNGNFPVGHWLEIKPYGTIAVSFRDRVEPLGGTPAVPTFNGSPLTGFNHAQAGLELKFNITRHMSFIPSMAYSYHISEPPPGTDRNEFFGGAKVAFNF